MGAAAATLEYWAPVLPRVAVSHSGRHAMELCSGTQVAAAGAGCGGCAADPAATAPLPPSPALPLAWGSTAGDALSLKLSLLQPAAQPRAGSPAPAPSTKQAPSCGRAGSCPYPLSDAVMAALRTPAARRPAEAATAISAAELLQMNGGTDRPNAASGGGKRLAAAAAHSHTLPSQLIVDLQACKVVEAVRRSQERRRGSLGVRPGTVAWRLMQQGPQPLASAAAAPACPPVEPEHSAAPRAKRVHRSCW